MDTVLQDLRYALRTLKTSPGYTSVAVLALALGIGVTTAVFSVLNGVVLQPLRYDAAYRIYGVWERSEGGDYRQASYPTFLDWREQSDVFEALAFVRGRSTLMPGDEGARRVGSAFVSENFFNVLRGTTLLGRTFSDDEQRPGGPPVAVLTHALWHERFGGARSALGSTIRLDDASYIVVGILPPWFQFPDWAEVYLPLAVIASTDRILAQRGFHADSRVIVKVKPQVSVTQAQTAMAGIQQRLAAAYPAESRGWTGVELVSLFEEELRFGAVRPILTLLAGAVTLVLLLACANVANMSLVRAATRSREFAIRAALGAGRGRVARLLLSESAVLALTGGGLGVLGARVRSLRFFESGNDIPPINQRRYQNRFSAADSRFVNAELTLDHRAPGRFVSGTIICRYFAEDNREIGRAELNFRIEPSWAGSTNTRGWGAPEAGSWNPGRYLVACDDGRATVAQATFQMY